ncbi:hypothetical protein Hte_000495 [Hypoxylon texense]
MTNQAVDSPYVYEDLASDEVEGPWIRLFKVRASAEPNGPIEITIRHAILKQKHDPKFWGLSYVWGQASDDVPLTVVDSDGLNKKWLPVRRSLYEFLLTLRSRDSDDSEVALHELEFWADRICINQDNLEERAHQVSLMGEIYWHAEGVHIWLGQDPGGLATKAFTEIRRYGDQYWFHPNDEQRFPFLNQSDVEKLDIDTWQAIKQLFEAQWFERVWILQEVGLGNKAFMWWGGKHFDFNMFAAFDFWLRRQGATAQHHFRLPRAKIIPALNAWYDYGQSTVQDWQAPRGSQIEMNFLKQLIAAAPSQTTDPRDRVYALLSHPSSRRTSTWEPDMRTDYRAICREPLLITPNYTKTTEVVYYETACVLLRQHRDLHPLGAVFHDKETFNLGLPTWVPRWDTIGSKIPLGCDLRTPWNCSKGGPNFDLKLMPFGRLCVTLWKWATVENFDSETDPAQLPFLSQVSREERKKVLPLCNGRKAFRSKERNDQCIGPELASTGDWIVFIFGSWVPHILRCCGFRTYTHLGTCYVAGIMHGEGMEFFEKEGRETQMAFLV